MIFRTILLFLVGIGTLQSAFCQAPAKTDSPAKDWKKISACGVELTVPREITQLDTKAIDSCVARFEGGGLSIGFDVGLYTSAPKPFETAKDFKEQQITVDGKKGRFATYQLPDAVADSRFIAILWVPLGETPPGTEWMGRPGSASVTISGGSPAVFDTAREIVLKARLSPIKGSGPKE